MWKGRGMIKERGCRVDVEGKGDGQAMVVCCCPALVLHVVVLSALHVVTSALHVLVMSLSHVIACCHRLVAWLCCGVIILLSCVLVLSLSAVGWEEGGKGVLTVLF